MKKSQQKCLRLEEAGGHAIVAVESQLVKGRSDTVPPGHGCGFNSLDAREDAATTLPRPIGRLTRMISSSISVPRVSALGQRKYTPVELMSRVTSVIGNCSGTLLTLRSRNGAVKWRADRSDVRDARRPRAWELVRNVWCACR